MKYLFAALGALFLVSCTTEHGSATPGYWAPSSPVDPTAKFGILLEVNPVVLSDK